MGLNSEERYLYRSIFVPALQGRADLWKAFVRSCAEGADEGFQLGNFINPIATYNNLKRLRKGNRKLVKFLELWRASDDRWTTLLGPNEAFTLNTADAEWVDDSSHKAIRDGWFGSEPIFKVAGVSKGRLVTACGLTHGEWLKIGAPDDAQEAADRLNEKYRHKLFFGPGWRVGDTVNFDASPVMAHPISEVYASWTTSADVMPFAQIHGAENFKVSQGYVLTSGDWGFDERTQFLKVMPWGSIFACNDNFFLGVNGGLSEIYKLANISDFVVYSEVTHLDREAVDEAYSAELHP